MLYLIIIIISSLIFLFVASLFGSGNLLGSKLGTIGTTTSTSTTNRGLGGLDISSSNKGLSQGNTNSTAKENVWPPELLQTIEKFK